MTSVLIAIVLYLAAATLLVRRVALGQGAGSALWAIPAVGAVLAHAFQHVLAWREVGGADLHFFSALS
ncbi:MAG: cytochrome C assembly family protein, partial [Luteimonas sp.]